MGACKLGARGLRLRVALVVLLYVVATASLGSSRRTLQHHYWSTGLWAFSPLPQWDVEEVALPASCRLLERRSLGPVAVGIAWCAGDVPGHSQRQEPLPPASVEDAEKVARASRQPCDERGVPLASPHRSGLGGSSARLTSAWQRQRPLAWVHRLPLRSWVAKRADPTDPLFSSQWHVRPTDSAPHLNVLPVWDNGVQGAGVTVAIVDDGYETTHPDLSSQYSAASSRNYRSSGSVTDPSPQAPGDAHGTACAGLVGALRDNGVCGAGVAPQATLSGILLLGQAQADTTVVNALSFADQVNDVYSNSWGAPDNGLLHPLSSLLETHLRQAVTTGRGGLGSIFVWAAGNGNLNQDNANYEGFVSSPFTIGVSATGYDGVHSFYSEPGACILVTAPSQGSVGPGIATSDRLAPNGYSAGSDCTTGFSGTSAACPQVSGVVALMLSANPSLTWKDVQHILVRTAAQVDPASSTWSVNGANFPVSHRYGFGLVNAEAAVSLAEVWTSVGSAVLSVGGASGTVDKPIPAYSFTGPSVSDSITISDDVLVDQVSVTVHITHSTGTDLRITLTSPMGTESVLAELHGLFVVPSVDFGGSSTNVVQGIPASFGPDLASSGPISGTLRLTSPADGCAALSGFVEGSIAVIDRGTCTFLEKVEHAQNAGATAVLILNLHEFDMPTQMGASGTTSHIAIVPLLVDADTADTTRASLQAGNSISVTFDTRELRLIDNVAYNPHTMLTVHAWGERSRGAWVLTVEDQGRLSPPSTGSLLSWSLTVYHSNSSATLAPTAGPTAAPTPATNAQPPAGNGGSSSSSSSSSSNGSDSDDDGVATLLGFRSLYVYAAIALLIVFLVALIVCLCLCARRRRNRPAIGHSFEHNEVAL